MLLESADDIEYIGRGKASCSPGFCIYAGQLCSPLRRMCSVEEGIRAANEPGSERWWNRFPIHRNVAEWAGYSQILHAGDPHLGPAPWHEIDWIHAGGADSFFQQKWPQERKIRPPFEVLHLGPAGQNWFGRATPYLDGSIPEDANVRKFMSSRMIWEQRRINRANGKDQFEGERVKPRGE